MRNHWPLEMVVVLSSFIHHARFYALPFHFTLHYLKIFIYLLLFLQMVPTAMISQQLDVRETSPKHLESRMHICPIFH